MASCMCKLKKKEEEDDEDEELKTQSTLIHPFGIECFFIHFLLL